MVTNDEQGEDAVDRPAKNIGRRRLLQILTAGGGLAAAGMIPPAWATPVADVGDQSAEATVDPTPQPPQVDDAGADRDDDDAGAADAGVVAGTPTSTG